VGAQLNKPSGVAVAPNGDIYIADTLNCLVRKVDASTLKISTVAGVVPNPVTNPPNCGSASAYPSGPAPDDFGAATSAILRYPYDVSLLYPDDDLLIAERADSVDGLSNGHNRIRRVDVPAGIISTAAGGGSCTYPYTNCLPTQLSLSNPEGVAAVDYQVYIAQAGDNSHPIVSFHAVTNTITTATVSGITISTVKSVAVNTSRTLAISNFGTTSSDGNVGSGNDLSGNPSSSYQPTASCTILPGIQSIDWLLPAALLGLIMTRKRLRTLFIVLRSATT